MALCGIFSKQEHPEINRLVKALILSIWAVSYTHLDVYKRQERILSWLNRPLFPDAVIRAWMAIAAGAALLLALILAFVLIRRKKKRGDKAVEEPITERPEPLPELELANLQGVGSREEPVS